MILKIWKSQALKKTQDVTEDLTNELFFVKSNSISYLSKMLRSHQPNSVNRKGMPILQE